MRAVVVSFAALLMVSTVPAALAQQTQHPKANSQQERMQTCNTQAGAQKLSGDARKTFMSNCLSGKTAGSGSSQQDKMKSCNAEAASHRLSGAGRRQFMSNCLKGS
jgi:hypothetical protein